MTDIVPKPVRFHPETPADLVGRWILLRSGQKVRTVRVETAALTYESGMSYTKVVDSLPGQLRVEYSYIGRDGYLTDNEKVVDTDTGFALATAADVDVWLEGRSKHIAHQSRGLFRIPSSYPGPLVFAAFAFFIALGVSGSVVIAGLIGGGLGAVIGFLFWEERRRIVARYLSAVAEQSIVVTADHARFHGADAV